MAFDLPDGFNFKSPWVLIPAGVGGAAGLVMLLRRPAGSSSAPAPTVVTGQDPVATPGSSAYNAIMQAVAGLAEQVNEQDADIAEQLGAVSAGLADALSTAIEQESLTRESATAALSAQIQALISRPQTPHTAETVTSPELQARERVGEAAIEDTSRRFNVPSWTMLAFLGTYLRLPRDYAEYQQFAAQEGWYNPQSGAWTFPEVRSAVDIPVTWSRRFYNWWDKFRR